MKIDAQLHYAHVEDLQKAISEGTEVFIVEDWDRVYPQEEYRRAQEDSSQESSVGTEEAECTQEFFVQRVYFLSRRVHRLVEQHLDEWGWHGEVRDGFLYCFRPQGQVTRDEVLEKLASLEQVEDLLGRRTIEKGQILIVPATGDQEVVPATT